MNWYELDFQFFKNLYQQFHYQPLKQIRSSFPLAKTSGSFSVAGNRVLYKNSKDKYKKHPYVMRFIYIAYASVMTAACKT